jgi:CrcB protein
VLIRVLLVAVGGSLGASARYLTSLLAGRLFGAVFPAGTLLVNLGGCLLTGFGFSLAERGIIGPQGRLLLLTGFLGGFTTFSTFALETITYLADGARSLSLFNLALNNGVGLLLVVVGLWLGRVV